MTPGELAAVRGRLEEFAPLAGRDQRDKGGAHVRGLLLDGRRKSMQPMAERLGVDEQGLRKKTFGKKAEADRFAATVEADKHRCQYVDHADRTTVVEYARTWADPRPHRASTAARVLSLIDVHIAGTRLGQRRLADVRRSGVQAWATDRAQVLAPSTLRALVQLLRSIYSSAVLDRLVASSPVVRVQLPPDDRERVVPLTVAEVLRLADAMGPRSRAMVITQAGLGLRLGELLALRMQDIYFLRRTVRVEFQIAPRTQTRTEPKTPHSLRTIPPPQVVADALAAHIAEHPPGADGSLSSPTPARSTAASTTARCSRLR